MEAAETLKNDDSGGSDREDTASKASDSSMHSPNSHSRSFGNSNGTSAGEPNNNKISMGNHNSPAASNKEHQHKSPSFRSCSPGSAATEGSEKSGPAMGLHHSQLPPPGTMLNGKSVVLSPPPPGLPHHHHHHHHLHANHLHNGHPLPLHSHLMHPGVSPSRTTPPTLPLSLTTNTSNGGTTNMVNSSPSHHLGAHHPNGLTALEATKGLGAPPASFHPESDPEAFRWVNSYNREPISMIR